MRQSGEKKTPPGLIPSEWEDLFRKAGIQVDALDAAKSHRARATLLGNFLAQNLDREVPIEVDGRPGMARLRVADAGKRQRRYYFEIRWETGTPPDPRADPETDGEPPAPTRRRSLKDLRRRI